MSIFRNRLGSIRVRLIAATMAVGVMAFGLTAVYSIVKMANIQEAALDTQIRSQSESGANAAAALLELKLGFARAMGKAIESIVAMNDDEKRRILDNVVKGVAQEEGISAAYANFDKGKFFGPGVGTGDNKPGASYFKDGKGEIVMEPSGFDSPIDSSAGWYWDAIRRERECLVEPYRYSYKEGMDSVLLISITVPIKVGGSVAGVAGIDIPLDKLQKLTGEIHPIPGAYAILVSNQGVRAAHPKPELWMKRLGDDMTDSARGALLDAIGDGRAVSVEKPAKGTGKMSRIQYSPIRIGETNQPWALGLVFPLDDMREPVRVARRDILIATCLGIGFLAVFLGWLVAKLLKPLERTAGLMREMAEGDGDLTRRVTETGIRETDRLGGEFNRFAEVTRVMVANVIGQIGRAHV